MPGNSKYSYASRKKYDSIDFDNGDLELKSEDESSEGILCSKTEKSIKEIDANENENKCMLCQHELKTIYYLSCCWCQNVICLTCFVAYKKKFKKPEICHCIYKDINAIQINFSPNTVQGKFIVKNQNLTQIKNDKLFYMKYEKLGKAILFFSGMMYFLYNIASHFHKTYTIKRLLETNFPCIITLSKNDQKFEIAFMVSESVPFFIFALKLSEKTEFRNIILSELVESEEIEKNSEMKVLETEVEECLKVMVDIISKERVFSKFETDQEKEKMLKYFNEYIIRY